MSNARSPEGDTAITRTSVSPSDWVSRLAVLLVNSSSGLPSKAALKTTRPPGASRSLAQKDRRDRRCERERCESETCHPHRPPSAGRGWLEPRPCRATENLQGEGQVARRLEAAIRLLLQASLD